MGTTVFIILMLQKYINLKQKILKIKKYPLCLGNISGGSPAKKNEKKKKKKGLKWFVYDFSVDYRAFDTSNIIDINKYLMTKHGIK